VNTPSACYELTLKNQRHKQATNDSVISIAFEDEKIQPKPDGNIFSQIRLE